MNLIAREAQLQKLATTVSAAMRGRLQIVFVTGEAGAGKTALLEAFVEYVRNSIPEVTIVGSKCRFVIGSEQDPFAPFIQILQTLLQSSSKTRLGRSIRRILNEVAPDWIGTLPVVGDVFAASIRTVQAVRGEFVSSRYSELDVRLRMVQYTDALAQISSESPLLLWIDDLHWSDNASLDLLSFLADYASNTRMMLLLTFRPTDVIGTATDRLHPVMKLVTTLERYGQCITIPLPPFTLQDTAAMLDASQHVLPQQFVVRLWRQSGGNPLFVREYLNLLHSRNLVRRQSGKFVLSQSGHEIDIPQSVLAVVDSRIGVLSEDLRRLIECASVQGERFRSQVLAQVAGFSELAVLEKLDALVGPHQLISEISDGLGELSVAGVAYQFNHALIQAAIYERLGMGRRRILHFATAEALENLLGPKAIHIATEIAQHYEQSETWDKSAFYYLQSARNALLVLAFDDALESAACAERTGRHIQIEILATSVAVDALIARSEALFHKADFDNLLLVAANGEDQCKNYNLKGRQAALLYWRGRALREKRLYSESFMLLKQAALLCGEDESNQSIQGYIAAEMAHFFQYNYLSATEASALHDQAIRIAEQLNTPDMKISALLSKAGLAADIFDAPEGAVQLSEEALLLSRKYRYIRLETICHLVLARLNRRLKNSDSAATYMQGAVESARRAGLPHILQLSLMEFALYWWEIREDADQAMQFILESVEIADRFRFPVHGVNTWFIIAFGQGRWDQVLEIQNRTQGLESENDRETGSYYVREGHLALARGQCRDAVLAYQRASTVFANVSSTERDFQRVQPFLGVALVECGEYEQGKMILSSAAGYWRNRHGFRYARCLRGLARIEMMTNNLSVAVELLQRALELAVESFGHDGWPDWRHIQINLAESLLGLHRSDEAYTHAYAAYEGLKTNRHFLLGEAAFTVGQTLVALNCNAEATQFFDTAKSDWERLGFMHLLSTRRVS